MEIVRDDFLRNYLELDAKEIKQIAHQPGDMIKYCSMHGPYGDDKCEELRQGSVKIFTARYGVCYMFNHQSHNGRHKEAKPLRSSYGGPEFGLELIIDMESKY